MEWEQVLKKKKIDFSVFKEALLRTVGDVVVLNQGLAEKVLDEYIKLYRVKTGKPASYGLSRDAFKERMFSVLRQSGGKVLVNNGYSRQFSDETFSDGDRRVRERGYIYTRGE